MRTERARHAVYWAPRLLGLAFAGFLGLFAADVSESADGVGAPVLALLMHLIPALLVLGTILVAWRHEWIAALAFPLLAALHIGLGPDQLHWSAYAVIDGPLILIGVLFLLSWRQRAAAATP